MAERILLALANQSTNELELAHELQLIREIALANAIRNKHIDYTERNAITYDTLSQLMYSDEGRSVTMLHYAGHSSAGGWWVERDGDIGLIDTERLARLFTRQYPFRFVFLNGCRSRRVADALISAKVATYVIGTSNKINDKQAALVARKFYEILGNNPFTVPEAFQRTKDYFTDPLFREDNPQPDAKSLLAHFRDGAVELDDEDAFPWKLYPDPVPQNYLTPVQQTWTLIPPQTYPECYELYQIGGMDYPGKAARRTVSFVVVHARPDEDIKQEIIGQLRVFYQADLISLQNDQSIFDSQVRKQRISEMVGEADFLVGILSKELLTSAFGASLLSTIASRQLLTLPVMARDCSLQGSFFQGILPFPEVGRPICEYTHIEQPCRQCADLLTKHFIKPLRR